MRDHLRRGVAEVVRRDQVDPGARQDRLALLHIGAFEADNKRQFERDLPRGGDDALGDHVAAHDAAEDVDQDAAHVGVREDDFEGLGHPLAGGAAADIEEVGGLRAVQLDDVHGRHGESRAVDHAADVAVELDVAQLVLGCRALRRVLLVRIAQRGDLAAPVERVVVDAHLGVEGDERALSDLDQGVDLDQACIGAEDGVVDRAPELAHRLRRLAGKAEAEGEAAGVVGLEAARRIDRHGHDGLRGLGCDRLDLDAAFARGDEGDAPAFAVHHGAEIVLVGDVGAFLQVDAAHLAACGSRLVGDEHLAEHRARRRDRLVAARADLHAARLAAPAGVDLRLDHPDRAAELVDRSLDTLRREHGHAARHRHAERRQHLLGLIFVEVHGAHPPRDDRGRAVIAPRRLPRLSRRRLRSPTGTPDHGAVHGGRQVCHHRLMQQESDRPSVRTTHAVGGGAAVRDVGRRLSHLEPE